MIIGIRGRPAVGDVNVATTRRRRLERSLPPRTLVDALPMILLIMVLMVTAFLMKFLTMFRLPDGRMRKERRRRTSQHARLQTQDRPLADPARRTVLLIPRVIAASRRPGAKRVPGRGVVHDELHIALNSRDLPHPAAAAAAAAPARCAWWHVFLVLCVRLHRRRHLRHHTRRSDGRRRGARMQRHSDICSFTRGTSSPGARRPRSHSSHSDDSTLGPRWRSIDTAHASLKKFARVFTWDSLKSSRVRN